MGNENKTKDQVISEIEQLRLEINDLQSQESYYQKLVKQLQTEVTENKYTKEFLRKNEECFRLLYERSPMGYQSLDCDGNLIEVNPAWLSLLGYEKEDVIGRSFADFLASGFPELFKERFPHFKASGRACSTPFVMVARDGSHVDVEIDGKIGYNVDGSFKQSHCILHDVTDRKQAEDALLKSEEKFRQLFSTTTDSVMLFDAQTRQFIDVNEACEELYGYSRSEFLNLTQNDITAEPADSAETIGKVIEDGTVQIPLRYHKKKDGTIFPVEISGSSFKVEDREVVCGLIRDITERKRANQMTKESEKRFRSLSEAAFEGVVFTENGVFVDANAAFTRMYGYSFEELKGKQVIDLVAPEDRKLVAENLRSGYEGIYEHRGLHKDGSLLDLEIHGSSVTYQGREMRLTAIRDITERKQAEEQLRQSEERFRSFTENAPDFVMQIDNDGIVRFINRTLEGLSQEDIVGSSIFSWLPEDYIATLKQGLAEVFETAQLRVIEHQAWDAKREGRWYSSYLAPIGEHGNVTSVIIVARDITERKHAEDALTESAARLQLATNATRIGHWDWDLRTNEVYFSPEWKRQLGYGDNEIPNQFETWQSHLHPDDQQRTIRAVEDYIAGRREDYTVEFRLRHKDGSYRWIYTRGEKQFDDTGKPCRLFGCHVDITDRKRAEEQCKRASEFMQTVIDGIPEAMMVINRDYTIAMANRTVCELAGSKDPVTDLLKCYQVSHNSETPCNCDHHRCPLKEVIETKATVTLEHIHFDAHGREIIVELCASPIFDEKGQVVQIIEFSRDITERKHAEKEREQLLKTLEYKNNELQEIVYTTSHDLRSPLVNIRGFGDELNSDCEHLLKMLADDNDSEENREKIEDILTERIPTSLSFITSSTNKMSSLLDGLLQVSRVGTVGITSESIDVNKTVDEVLAAMEYQIKENNITVTVETLGNCIGDGNMLNNVFSNLIGNAIKYCDHAKKSEISISGSVEDGKSIYCVADNGIGIAAGHQEKVFGLFHRLNPRENIEGEGLGLTIVTRIMYRLGGKIWLESEPGKGSKFFVALPTA
ncbi:MAG: PAS domain S-box protein [Planctomycetes bacterium]|nr:PAS domain S-box protein [Planctomycetota bacterium]